MSDPLNVILIQIDSLNRHFLECYGNDWIEAPTLAAFAKQSAIFDQHYTGSLPCMPARREIWTGSEEFWWRYWGPLEPWDQPIAYLARKKGVVTQLVTDHYHLFEWGSHSFNYDYNGYEFIRGHESDNWRTDPVNTPPDWATKMVERRGADAQIYLRNVQHFNREADFFAPQVMQTTADWIERNHQQEQFFLHVDCFDVHEPFHIPEPYRSMYTDQDYRQYNPWPIYGRTDSGRSALSDAEIDWVRAQFAGKLTMVDRWLARVMDQLDRHQLLERTCVIITTDHGHYLGDHQWMGKPDAPLYHTLCHIPLMVWHPQGAHNGARVSAMTQTIDLYATVLDILGAGVPQNHSIHSRSLAPVLMGKTDQHRDHAVYSYYGSRIGITAGEWTLLRDHDANAAPLNIYTHQVEHLKGFGWPMRTNRKFDFSYLEAGQFISGVNMPVWKMPVQSSGEARPDLLFHNPSDPGQEHNRVAEQPDVVRRLEGLLRDHAQSMNVPEEQLKRLHL